jgi:Protein of unknown function (DUF1592)/Protein of unknown function (DUF1588)/Protein of unknown function (DUF1595)/Protein of unknown function (DUF1587)
VTRLGPFACGALACLGAAACAPKAAVTSGAAADGGTTLTSPTGSGALTLDEVGAHCGGSRLAPGVLRRLTRQELENTILDVFPSIGAQWSGVDLGPDPVSTLGFGNDASSLLMGEQTGREVLATAKDVATLVTDAAHLPGIEGCAASEPGEACAEQFLADFGPRLYRRPLTDDEHAELLASYRSVSARAGFPLGLKWMLVAMLESPELLYRSELGDGAGKLDPFEVATELAYAYGGSAPGPDLLAKADRGELGTPEAREVEARALLATPRGQDAFMEFFREWSGYERVLGTDKAEVGLGEFTTVIAPLLAEETRRFFDAVVIQGDGNVKDLLTTGTTYLDSNLAGFYGYGAGVTDFAPVERPAGKGIGILAQASILASRAHYDFTSPTFRGLFVYSQLLCRQPLARPMNVPAVQDAPAANTTRERYETQHEQGACAACHRLFEPFGYGLEHFDAAGLYRVNENGYDIDAHAIVPLDASTTLEFDGLEDLAHKLAGLPEVTDCVSGLLTNYVFGGAGGQTCLAEEARTGLAEGQVGLRDFYLSLTAAPSFAKRAR